MALTEEGAKGKAARGKGGPQAVTANRLDDGIVVFLADGGEADGTGAWAERPAAAAIAGDAAAAAALLAVAERAVAARLIVAPYLIEMTETAGGPRPASLRERIRAAGPTVRTDLGKQAEQEEPTHVPL